VSVEFDIGDDVPKEFDNARPEDFKDRFPIILARVSSSRQRGGLDEQADEMMSMIRRLGYRKEFTIVKMQTSGKAADLKTLNEVARVIKANPRRSYVVFVRDVSRFARNTKAALIAVDFFGELGVPVFALDIGHSPGPNGTTSRMIFTINAAVAESGKKPEQDAQKKGEARRAEEGVFSGREKNLYPELARKGKSVYRQLWEVLPAIQNGTISQTKTAKAIGLGTFQFRAIRDNLRGIESTGGPEKVEEYLQVVDAIVGAEQQRGVGSRARPYEKRTERSNALHRVTVAYLKEPFNWPRPDTVGNPDTAEKRFRDKAKGTIDDALQNPKYYRPLKK